MASLLKGWWAPRLESGLSRAQRQGCWYYLPDLLRGREFVLGGRTAADVADAEHAVRRLNGPSRLLASTDTFARLLLRAEAVASSRIEGLEVGGRRLLRAQFARGEDSAPHRDVTAAEVLNNIEAMRWAIEDTDAERDITVEHLTGMHSRLLTGTAGDRYAGVVRNEQNWIGGNAYNPCRAAFVPPPPGELDSLLYDLCEFCNGDDLPAVAQAAIAHAQFETIHPFVDGNGRTGRALIHLVLRRRGLAPAVVPPISLVLATWSDAYIGGLIKTRYVGSPADEAARQGVDDWLALIAGAILRAVADAELYEARVEELQIQWRQRLGRVRSDSAVDRLLTVLPELPMVTVKTAAARLGRSEQAVNEAIPRLVEAGVLKQVTVGRRSRAFEAAELINAFTDLERQLASPGGDTRVSPPARRVPHRW